MVGVDPRQGVDNAAVTQAGARGRAWPLADVLGPGAQSTDRHPVDQQAEVAGHRRRRHAKTQGNPAGIEVVTLFVRERGPQAAQALARNARREQRHVALKVDPHELLAPRKARFVVVHEEGVGEATPPPRAIERLRASRKEVAWCEFEGFDASGTPSPVESHAQDRDRSARPPDLAQDDPAALAGALAQVLWRPTDSRSVKPRD